ncbi:MAG: hypothetical protein ACRDWI_18480 [Jiangellaceae bacterium]
MSGFRPGRLTALPRGARLRTGHLTRRYVGRARRLGERLVLRVPALFGRVERAGMYVVVSKLPCGDDADARAVLDCANAFASAGVAVHILVLEFARDAEHQAALLHRRELLPAGVSWRYFWRHAAPSGDGGWPVDALRDLPPAAQPVTMPGMPARTTYFVDGLPVARVTDRQRGLVVEHLGPDGAPRRRDDYDERHRLVRMVDVSPETGKVATRRYLDADGTCWLSAWVGPSGRSGPLQVHLPTPTEYASDRDVRARWVTRELHRSAAVLVVAADAASGRVVSRSRHPAAHRLAVEADPRPVRVEDLLAYFRHVTKPAWRRGRRAAPAPPAPLRRP